MRGAGLFTQWDAVEVSMPTDIRVGREYPRKLSLGTVCLHALLAAAIIGAIALTVIWAYI